MPDGGRTRREAIGLAAALGAGAALGVRPAARAGAAGAVVSLPTPAQVRADFTRMVQFGPRLTGSDAHNRYIDWLEREFVKAGCELLSCDTYHTQCWEMQRFGLDVLDGSSAGAVKVGTYYPRSQETPAGGVEGPLVYGGAAPSPAITGTDLGALQAALARYPADLASWASALPGTLGGGLSGSIVVVDLPVPVPATAAAFLPLATHLNWKGHTELDWAQIDYKRLWIMPGLGLPLAPFQAAGAKGVVFVVDASAAALEGAYIPFTHGFEPLPALYVDRDTGAALRATAGARPRARLTLTATRRSAPTPAVTAVLKGESSETLIFNTHTDGQGFVEENAGVAFVQLARHFASLPADQRLKRTLVFAAWPGHMVADLPQTQGWIDAHPDLVARAAAALTVEHLGCTEWVDSADKGYHATGEAELFGIWTTQGTMFELVRDTVDAHDIPRAALLRPGVQFGVGAAFQGAGVPQIGAIAGPEYLLNVVDGGDLDKLDETLAARQIAWLADLARKLDGVSREQLRQGDPTLGAPPIPPEGADAPHQATACGPALFMAHGLTVRWYGLRRARRGALLHVDPAADATRVTVELRRNGKLVARLRDVRIPGGGRDLVLRRAKGRRFATGTYTLRVRRGATVLLDRRVRLDVV